MNDTDTAQKSAADEAPAYARSRMFEREVEMQVERWREREVRATERAARWAFGSLVVSLLALAVSLWPMVKGWLQ